jgi:hypothetical protein
VLLGTNSLSRFDELKTSVERTGASKVSRWFWLVNLALLALYGWTLTEDVVLSIEVADGQCVAVASGRTSEIGCPELAEGFVGIYLSDTGGPQLGDIGPLDWLAPRSAWHELQLTAEGEKQRQVRFQSAQDVAGWRQVLDEYRPEWESAVMIWRLPQPGDFMLKAGLRRLDEQAGLLLLEADGRQGLAFIISPPARQGVWWLWRDRRPAEPLVGIPFQKSFLAQAQSLLRRLLRAHHGALLLLAVGWVATRLVERARKGQPLAPFRRRNTPQSRILLRNYLLVGVTFLVFLATFTIADDVLERIPHVQDSVTYLFQAKTMAGGHLWAPAPALPAFFEQEFLLVEGGALVWKVFSRFSPDPGHRRSAEYALDRQSVAGGGNDPAPVCAGKSAVRWERWVVGGLVGAELSLFSVHVWKHDGPCGGVVLGHAFHARLGQIA